MNQELLEYSTEIYGESWNKDTPLTLSQLISSHRHIRRNYEALNKEIGRERKAAYAQAYKDHTDWLETTQAFTLEFYQQRKYL
jgi:hypothetical protein